MPVGESTNELPKNEKGNPYYNACILLIPVVVCAIVGGVGGWICFGIFLVLFLLFLAITLGFFIWWFVKYTKLQIIFEGKAMTIGTTFGLFPCYNTQLQLDMDQINAFFIKEGVLSKILPAGLKRYRVYAQNLAEKEYLLSSSNNLAHQKKLVKLFMAQPGLTQFGEVERVRDEKVKIGKQRKQKLKERERIMAEREKRREERLKKLEERKNNMGDIDEEDRDNALKNWRRVKDHKKLRSKYGPLLS